MYRLTEIEVFTTVVDQGGLPTLPRKWASPSPLYPNTSQALRHALVHDC